MQFIHFQKQNEIRRRLFFHVTYLVCYHFDIESIKLKTNFFSFFESGIHLLVFWHLHYSDFNFIFIHKYSLIFYLLIIHGILNTFLSGNDDESKTDTISHLQHLLNKFYNKNEHPIFRWYVCKREGVIDVGDDPNVRRKPHLQAETEHTIHIKMQWAILWKLARFFIQKCHPTLNFSIIQFNFL